MFKVTVAGKYVKSGKLAEIDYYETTFDMSEGREAYARAIIQNSGMLDERLIKECKNFKRWQTCSVTGIEEVTGEGSGKVDAELDALLAEAVELACIPTTYKRMKKVSIKKDALKEAIERKKERIEKAKAKRGGMQEEAA